MRSNAIWNVLRRNLTPLPSPLAQLDSLELEKKVVYVSVKEEDVVLHCYLLEHFVSIKHKIHSWADKEGSDSDAVWKCYVNLGIRRLISWLEESFYGMVDLDRHIPPLDVLLVWHAFLQDPVQWNRFVRTTKIDFARWNPNALLTALENDEPGQQFCPSRECLDKINIVYQHLDSRAIIYMAADLVQTAVEPNLTTDLWTRSFTEERLTHTLVTPQERHDFTFDFHASVQRQLELAERFLKFSWHRMYSSLDDNQHGLRPAVKRYQRYMTISRFWDQIERLELGTSDRPGFTYLDIDIVWRTHVLAPREYRCFCNAVFGCLIPNTPSPPDRHKAKTTLLDATSQIYEHIFGEEYALCLCRPCFNSRRGESPGPYRSTWNNRLAAMQLPKQEMDRRSQAGVSIPLDFAEKQCRKCGSHPWRHCREKDIMQGPDTIPPVTPVRASGMHPYDMGSQSSSLSYFRLPVLGTQEPIWRETGTELHHPSQSRASTPALTTGSTYSDDSDGENSPSGVTLTGSPNTYQIPRMEATFRNADATGGNPRDTSRIGRTNGPEPGAWLAG
ncbi:hypothetical protein FGRMN_9238 [Fusarium graminum]|nr:hypothetical protein FGRMN_9238 [Fusarium graminum]